MNWAQKFVLLLAMEEYGVVITYLTFGNKKLALYWFLIASATIISSTFK